MVVCHRSYHDLSEGSHVFFVRRAGLEHTVSERSWTVDLTGPVVMIQGPYGDAVGRVFNVTFDWSEALAEGMRSNQVKVQGGTLVQLAATSCDVDQPSSDTGETAGQLRERSCRVWTGEVVMHKDAKQASVSVAAEAVHDRVRAPASTRAYWCCVGKCSLDTRMVIGHVLCGMNC